MVDCVTVEIKSCLHSMASSSTLTNAAINSRRTQSSLLSAHSRKRRKRNDNFQNSYTNVAILVSVGCFIGYSMNYIYNKYYLKRDDDDYSSDDDENIDEFHKKRISELKKSRSSMFTLPPHYSLKVYQSENMKTNNRKKKQIQKEKPLLNKSISSIWTPRKKKKPKKDINQIYNEKQIILNELKNQIFTYKHSVKRNLLFVSNESHDGYQKIKQFMGEDINNLLLIPFGHVCVCIYLNILYMTKNKEKFLEISSLCYLFLCCLLEIKGRLGNTFKIYGSKNMGNW